MEYDLSFGILFYIHELHGNVQIGNTALQHLIMLHLGRNSITEFRRESVEDLKNLNFIFLNENPLDQKSLDEYHKRLKFP
ncbi:MAG: hypothetical protein ACFFDF_08480 [Candidatus Odinarchaeota archaeon]